MVDIQGVGDLYTDPQIHTSLGFEYGGKIFDFDRHLFDCFCFLTEGNLGIRGMALFFSTHECNPICTRLNLTPFDLSAEEREKILQQHVSSPLYAAAFPAQTACRGSEEPLNGLAKFGSFLRRLRSQSSISEDDSDGYVSEASSLTAANAHPHEQNLSTSKPNQFMTTFSEDNIPLSSSLTTKFRLPPLSSSITMISASPVSLIFARNSLCLIQFSFDLLCVFF